MSYSFWETVQGHRLSEVLIRSLPKIAGNGTASAEMIIDEIRALRNENSVFHEGAISEQSWQQYTIKCYRWDNISAIINQEIEKGSVYVDSIEYTDYKGADNNQILIIMKRPK